MKALNIHYYNQVEIDFFCLIRQGYRPTNYKTNLNSAEQIYYFSKTSCCHYELLIHFYSRNVQKNKKETDNRKEKGRYVIVFIRLFCYCFLFT